jgi:hypothetical protein
LHFLTYTSGLLHFAVRVGFSKDLEQIREMLQKSEKQYMLETASVGALYIVKEGSNFP